MPSQNGRIAQYFDQISTGYTARYGRENPFHNYFFRERLRASTEGLEFDGKTLLDIGAGTGALFNELTVKSDKVDYFACDLSAHMLAQSSIPAERAFVGRASDCNFPREKFDYIYLLGVTTYQEPNELADTWRFIRDRLAVSGTAIISFTNRASLDYVMRSTMKVAKPLVKRGVFGQSFETYAYRNSEVKSMVADAGLHVTRTVYLNQTISPFNTLLPRPSVSVAKFLDRRLPISMKPFFSSDFLIFANWKPSFTS